MTSPSLPDLIEETTARGWIIAFAQHFHLTPRWSCYISNIHPPNSIESKRVAAGADSLSEALTFAIDRAETVASTPVPFHSNPHPESSTIDLLSLLNLSESKPTAISRRL